MFLLSRIPGHGFPPDIATGGGVAGEGGIPLSKLFEFLMLATLALPFVPTPMAIPPRSTVPGFSLCQLFCQSPS